MALKPCGFFGNRREGAPISPYIDLTKPTALTHSRPFIDLVYIINTKWRRSALFKSEKLPRERPLTIPSLFLTICDLIWGHSFFATFPSNPLFMPTPSLFNFYPRNFTIQSISNKRKHQCWPHHQRPPIIVNNKTGLFHQSSSLNNTNDHHTSISSVEPMQQKALP